MVGLVKLVEKDCWKFQLCVRTKLSTVVMSAIRFCVKLQVVPRCVECGCVWTVVVGVTWEVEAQCVVGGGRGYPRVGC